MSRTLFGLAGMQSDDRFKHLANDPRFKPLRKKKQKVVVDERFKSIFTDEKFSLKPNKDKRGHVKAKSKRKEAPKEEKDEEQQQQEKREEELEEERAETEQRTKQVGLAEEQIDDEEQDKDEADSQGGDEDYESDVSTSSDEPESDQELASDSDDDGAANINQIQYNWEPLDHDAEQSDSSSNRLAIQNLDWDQLKVEDLYTLVNSIRPPLSVKIYISEFGKERLAREEIEGPQELVEKSNVDEDEEECRQLEAKMKALENQNNKMKVHKSNEYEDADEVVESANEEVRERIRRYQLNRMKYFYAVAEFDSVESAEVVYKELDGMEYEGSSLELDLRFIPDEMEFDPADVKAECNKLPESGTYKAPLFINSALQQTTVRFTWDETDVKRQKQLKRAFTKEELEKDDLNAYLASETESEHDEEVVGKYKSLLEGLDEEEGKKKKVGLDVEWDNDDGDGQDEHSTSKKNKSKKKRSNNKVDDERGEHEFNDGDDDGAEVGSEGHRDVDDDDDLDLLMMDVADKPREGFQFNPDDDRFGAVYTSGLYNIDPSHPNFKRTEAFNQIAERKRAKRQKTSSK